MATNERAVAVRQGAGLTTRGAAVSTESVSFGGDIVRWSHLPRALRAATERDTAFVGECAVVDDVVDVLDGEPVEVCRAWRAYRDVLFVATVVRTALPERSGRRRKAPPWREHGLETFEVRGVPERRVGKVDAVIADAGIGGQVHTTSAAPVTPAHRSGADVWTFLPPAVRAGAEARVPTPRVWVGNLIQRYDSAGVPVAQDALTLRLDDSAAVVVGATRTVPAVPGATAAAQRARMARARWVVEQVSFLLGPADVDRPRLAGS